VEEIKSLEEEKKPEEKKVKKPEEKKTDSKISAPPITELPIDALKKIEKASSRNIKKKIQDIKEIVL